MLIKLEEPHRQSYVLLPFTVCGYGVHTSLAAAISLYNPFDIFFLVSKKGRGQKAEGKIHRSTQAFDLSITHLAATGTNPDFPLAFFSAFDGLGES
ncbi:hypothetical protein [Nostoc sp. UHCC 0252]|uniref:hypothetical protein n=1 Tax=Nostoc sp. UHCC 0252 TaxID=3110241 RepID=UPI002B20FECC|nr:hypothetical protein [Nostoc sp. UHCC 0252]MEA5600949.1 hypothetical protein [Nostoc sp. UHCC 0252]